MSGPAAAGRADDAPMRIFHLVDRQTWAAAVAAGQYRPAGFEQDGFVHFSFAGQVARVANALYRDEPDLIVVEVAADAAEVIVEDCYDSGEAFPHCYRPLDPSRVVATHRLARGPAGEWVFSTGDASASASPRR